MGNVRPWRSTDPMQLLPPQLAGWGLAATRALVPNDTVPHDAFPASLFDCGPRVAGRASHPAPDQIEWRQIGNDVPMSTIWTPSGERPVRREHDPAPQPQPGAGAGASPGGFEYDEPTDDEIKAHLAEVARQLLHTPASVVIANHCIGLFQLAALHLEEANLEDAKLAIDALGAVVETLGKRLGEEEATLREALAQLRLAYVQRSQQSAGG